MIIGIVAIAQNLAIGKNGELPWRYKSDLRFFKQTTSGNVVVMGKNTWLSIGKPLPNRLNVVLSRTLSIENQDNLLQVIDKQQVLSLYEYLKCDLCVIGGAKIYELFADVIEKWFVTEIPLTVEDADVFMPSGFLDNFVLSDSQTLDDGLCVKIYDRN